MGISTFPAPSAGGGETNDFILDKNGTTNTTFSPGRSFAGGGYSIVVTGSTAYDIYLLDANGSAVGYTNGTSIVASAAFETISALGLGTADVVAFTYNGPSTDATTVGDEPGAGAFLTSITPSDLPQIDDTAIVAGGNFASDVEISFISGTVTKAAKNVVVGSSTALVVTRPDDLIEDLAPYDLKAINPGITEPTSSGVNILSGTVTAGTDPSFVTTSPILGFASGSAISTAILVSDTEGTVVSWEVTAGALPTGLTLGTADGLISGTATADGNYFFTVTITDDGNNTNSQEFNFPIGQQLVAPNSTVVAGTSYVWFDASDDLTWVNADGRDVEYFIVAGGGGGGRTNINFAPAGGGGAGGLIVGTVTFSGVGTAAVTIGAGGATNVNGNDSIIDGYATATGGGAGGHSQEPGNSGGSGGGGGGRNNINTNQPGGTGIAGQGNDGATPGGFYGGGAGGGKGAAGSGQSGGVGIDLGAWATAIDIVVEGGYFAGGGGAAYVNDSTLDGGGLGGGGDASNSTSTAGTANTGGGGGGAGSNAGINGSAGGSGLVVLRWS